MNNLINRKQLIFRITVWLFFVSLILTGQFVVSDPTVSGQIGELIGQVSQTNSELTKGNEKNLRSLEKNYEKMNNLFQLMEETYTKTEGIQQNANFYINFINNQRRVNSMIIDMIGNIRFADIAKRPELAIEMTEKLKYAMTINSQSWELAKDIINPSNKMDQGQRLEMLRLADAKNAEAENMLNSVSQQIRHVAIQRRNNEELVTNINGLIKNL